MDDRDIIIALLTAGEIIPAEAARLAGVSRQLIRKWMIAAGVDWRSARNTHIARRFRKTRAGYRKKITKAQLRNGTEAMTRDYLKRGGRIHRTSGDGQV